MTEIHNDGLADHARGTLQFAVTLAARVAEQVARRREQAHREAEARSTQAAREMEARLQSQWGAERPELTQTREEGWWDRAREEQIARSYQVATSWAPREPEAADYQQRIAQELQDRYGLDVDTLDVSDPEVVAKAREARVEEQAAAQLVAAADVEDAQAEDAEKTPGQETEASTAHAAADTDRAAVGEHYDTAERRDAEAADKLHQGVDERAVEQHRIADQHQAAPAADAVRGSGRRPGSTVASSRPTKRQERAQQGRGR